MTHEELKKRLLENATLQMEWDKFELGGIAPEDPLFHKDTAALLRMAAAALPAREEVRRTFEVPEGHTAVRDKDGRATGETRPINQPGGMQDNATLDEYQEASSGTAVYPGQGTPLGLIYVCLKLTGETGEVSEKVGKAMRDHQFARPVIDSDGHKMSVVLEDTMTDAQRDALKLELGDVLWYVAAAARELGFDLSDIAHANLDKLHDRAARGTLQGSGDER